MRDAFSELGHDAWSCDLIDSETPGQHVVGDARDLLDDGWDLLVAHPPCTNLTKAGVHHLHRDESRWERMRQDAKLFLDFLHAPIAHVAVENPVPHRYAREFIGRPSQYVQPHEFGADTTKRTGLWLRGLPPLMAEVDAAGFVASLPAVERMPYINTSRGCKIDRGRLRSRTDLGMAAAMAGQWSEFLV